MICAVGSSSNDVVSVTASVAAGSSSDSNDAAASLALVSSDDVSGKSAAATGLIGCMIQRAHWRQKVVREVNTQAIAFGEIRGHLRLPLIAS